MISSIYQKIREWWREIVGVVAVGGVMIVASVSNAPQEAIGFRELAQPFLNSRSSSTHQGAYEFICSPIVEVLSVEFKGAYYSNITNIPQQNKTRIVIEIFGNQTNPKEAFENLVYSNSEVNCEYNRILGAPFDFNPGAAVLKNVAEMRKIKNSIHE